MSSASSGRVGALGVRPSGLSATLRHLGVEYGLPLLGFAALTLALSWPIARDFTTRVAGVPGADPQLNVWVLWHAKEAFLGHQPLFEAPLLYYPKGVTLWTHSPGPLTGLLALPFWGLGDEAAYNGALLLSLSITGFAMYLLARALRFDRAVSFFAGVMLMTSPMILGGLTMHIDKVFLALLPLTLLCLVQTFDLARSRWWAVAAAGTLLLTVFHGGWHFILAGLAVAFFALVWLWRARRDERPRLLRRLALLAATTAILVGPLLVVIARASQGEGVVSDRRIWSFYHQPDAAELLLPSQFSALFGAAVGDFLRAHNVGPNIESALTLAYTGLVLSAIALLKSWRRVWPWALFAALCAILALGPDIKWLGQREFTKYHLPVILPYAFISELPGLAFMRTPGRFIMVGFVAFAVAASYGLAWLVARWPRWRYPIVLAAIGLILLEAWPQPWPQQDLRDVPSFYKQIAQDPETYGVFDLPHKPRQDASGTEFGAPYQVFQTVHGKGIAGGYVSYVYPQHPIFPCWYSTDAKPEDIQVNGEARSCYTNAQYELAQNGYRYLVQHKPQKWYSEYKPGSAADKLARAFVKAGFPNATPIVDDDLTTVYRVPPPAEGAPIATTLELRDNWEPREDGWRWARSPATLAVISPTEQQAVLQITPSALHDPDAPNGSGQRGRLRVTVGDFDTVVDVAVDQTTEVPLTLKPGQQTIALALEAGNYRPLDFGVQDTRTLSFSTKLINLELMDGAR
ncbi:MAG: hypothetical protein U0768_02375 [Anaerolineae bacterium]